ncbi:response regulator [Aromatoleum toluclasticum]|uniref:response regulator n=1 Tax=Aromatoleum toluclasticum TaxID=92003 RepID=UPI000360FD56|nr:response regulator [Aromatoleum toluclasticum]
MQDPDANSDAHILVVEDSPTQAERLAFFLERHGHSYAVARNGREALELIAERPPALVISDVVMPEMDGYELCRHLKTDSACKQIPVILLTTLSDPVDVIKGLECGADNFIFKPFEERYLLSRVALVLANRSLRESGTWVGSENAQMGVEVFFSGRRFFITSDRLQILNLLLSTYETAVNNNRELATARDELRRLNEDLEAQVQARTAALEVANRALESERALLAQRVAERTAELERARADAEQASRTKSAFLATMSHEIRTPMNGVLGMVDVLAHGRLSEHQADLVRTIRESASTLLGIIDDILDFSKIEAERLEIERAPVSVADLVEGLGNSLVPVASRRGVDLVLFVSPSVPERVLSDEVRLRQVLYNLVGNAIKFSSGRPEKRGRVSIRVEVAEEAPLRISFRVTDNGIGIAPEVLSGLFTPFTQGELSTTRRFGGTGLGLAICKRLVDLMRGEIVVESAPGVGSTFTVTMPLEPAAEQPVRALPDLRGIECVIIAGSELEIEDLRVYLENAGARVTTANDERAAEAAAAALGGGPVVMIQSGEDAQSSTRGEPASVPHCHRLLITRGRRRRPRVTDKAIVTLDGDALRRAALLRAVAVAAGRASPDAFQHSDSQDLSRDAGAPQTIAEARAQDRLILVAEDDEINQKVILQQLALLGYAAEIAGNGVEALRLWRAERYALLLTDIHMPELDGYMLAQAIRQEEAPGRSRMPILALTANALRGEASRALAAGMDEYLVKPVQLAVLRAALEKWLPVQDAPRLPPAEVRDGQTVPAVDVAVLNALIGDDAGTVREFLTDYLASAIRLAQQLRTTAAEGDPHEVAAIAHKLKSSSRAVGAVVLGDLCAELENAGRSGNRSAIGEHMEAFAPALVEVEACIRAMLVMNP